MKTLKSKVVMLPTDGASRLYKSSVDGKLYVASTPVINTVLGHLQNLHLISSEVIEDLSNLVIGKIYYNELSGNILRVTGRPEKDNFQVDIITDNNRKWNILVNGYAVMKELLATTDKSFGIPLINHQFIEKYAEVGGDILEVLVEVVKGYIQSQTDGPDEEYHTVKTRKDNTVIIHPSKTTLTLEEAKQIAWKAYKEVYSIYGTATDRYNWEKYNYPLFEQWFYKNIPL